MHFLVYLRGLRCSRHLELVNRPVQVGVEVLPHAGGQDGLSVLVLDVAERHLDGLVLVERDRGVVVEGDLVERH